MNGIGTYACVRPSDEEALGAREPPRGLFGRVLGFLGLTPKIPNLHPEWKDAVDAAPWYTVSCFSYCVAGGLLLLRPEPLERHLQLFPWRVVGLSIFTNGMLSYMSDVETWGRLSGWKSADRVLATINSLLQVLVVVLACLGQSTFPPEPVAALGTGVATALLCKHRASAAMERADCDAYLRWHAAWHYTLPLGAVVGQLLLHRPCDYAFRPEESCAAVAARDAAAASTAAAVPAVAVLNRTRAAAPATRVRARDAERARKPRRAPKQLKHANGF